MQTRVEDAANKKMSGLNCAQSVACTYCDLAGIDEATMKKLTQGFAVGMGMTMEGTCGALVGATAVLGAIKDNPRETVSGTKEILQGFLEKNGTIVCKELKGITDGKVKMECVDCVRYAAKLLEEQLDK